MASNDFALSGNANTDWGNVALHADLDGAPRLAEPSGAIAFLGKKTAELGVSDDKNGSVKEVDGLKFISS